MQLTSKFILIAIALAYGGTAVSAVPVREFSVAARSAEYEDLNAREIDDMELFVREPFSLFGFGSSSSGARTPAQQTDVSNTGSKSGWGLPAGLLNWKKPKPSAGVTSQAPETPALHNTPPEAPAIHEAEPVVSKSKSKNKGRGARYDPKPTMDVASRRQFRKLAGQDSALLKEAAKDKNHAYHSTAIHMKKEAALRKNPKLLKQALNDPNHALHGTAHTVKARNKRQKKTLRAALRDENHPLHEAAVAHRNAQHDKTIRNAQLKDPKLVEAALANKNHKLHEAAHRVAAQDIANAFSDLPFN